MYKRFGIYLLLITLIVALLVYSRSQADLLQVVDAVALSNERDNHYRVLLVPLDSRPPCTQFVEQLASVAGISVQIPPSEIMDQYKQSANRLAMRQWFIKNAGTNDTAIVSADMLIHGGLLASRLNMGGQDDTQAVLEIFKQAKEINPQLKLYVFSIIPRLIIADTAENMSYQRNMLKYSIQKDIFFTFENPLDYQKLMSLEETLPPQIINRYLNLYETNKRLNYALINLAKQGVIDGLVIGQDDGHAFGIPNMIKQAVQHYIDQSGVTDKVFITRGTDEVALTILAHSTAIRANYKPRIYVQYSHISAPAVVMPFMPHSVDTTVNEKIQMVNGLRVSSPELADFTLYVHVGRQSLNDLVLEQAAADIKALLDKGRRVAVVDLTEDYYASETVFPHLMKKDLPLLQLSAYAGWNTTSNSIGTALAQVAIWGASTAYLSEEEMVSAWSANTKFLISRYFDDWYFQKTIQPLINSSLKKNGVDPYQLGASYLITNQMVQKMISQKAQYWYYRQLWQKPVTIDISGKSLQVIISDFSLTAELPWDRTFEIRLEPHMTIHKVNYKLNGQ